MKIKILIPLTAVILSIMMILSGCGKKDTSSTQNKTLGSTDSKATLDTTDMFTDRDYETGYDESTATKLTVSDSNSEISITKAGTYIISGSTSDGSITVDVADTDKVQIVLNGVSITSKASAALYVKSADKVFLTTVKGTENTLANGGTFEQIDDNNIDGAVFSKSDITFNGEGTLIIKSPAGHGIVGKDDVKLTSGTYTITAAYHGIDANDSIRIANATISITAGKDGLHCDNEEDSEKGYIYIASGTLDIKSDDDGIHATTYLTIDGGTIGIKAAEGLEATVIKINDGTINIEASDDGINAAKKSTVSTPLVEINGGKITIVMGQGDTDGIDSNGNIIINGGTVNITGNSAFDYDGTGTINGGTVIVNGSEVSTLTNQMMGGGMPGGMKGGMETINPNDAVTSATPDINGERPEMPQIDGSGENGNRPQRPDGENGSAESGKRQKPGSKPTANATDTETLNNGDITA